MRSPTTRILSTLLSACLFASFAVATSLVAPACSGPHSGKSEKLKKPREKERPEGEEVATEEATEADTKCRVNFFDEPMDKRRRRPSDSKRLTQAAEPILVEAEAAEGEARTNLLVEAITKISNALKKDPYDSEATFKLAVGYAMAGKQGCALELLKRLATLQEHPDAKVAKVARRAVKRAVSDPAFDGFKKDAQAALGE